MSESECVCVARARNLHSTRTLQLTASPTITYFMANRVVRLESWRLECTVQCVGVLYVYRVSLLSVFAHRAQYGIDNSNSVVKPPQEDAQFCFAQLSSALAYEMPIDSKVCLWQGTRANCVRERYRPVSPVHILNSTKRTKAQ